MQNLHFDETPLRNLWNYRPKRLPDDRVNDEQPARPLLETRSRKCGWNKTIDPVFSVFADCRIQLNERHPALISCLRPTQTKRLSSTCFQSMCFQTFLQELPGGDPWLPRAATARTTSPWPVRRCKLFMGVWIQLDRSCRSNASILAPMNETDTPIPGNPQVTPSGIPDSTLAPLRDSLLSHPLYSKLGSLGALQIFMQDHVFAVWDFMSLLKALQRELTCVQVPWLPVPEPRLARLLNEIVLGEESDVTEDGEAIGHFDLYLRAMREAGADTGPIESFIAHLRGGSDLESSLTAASVPHHVRTFVQQTFAVIQGGKVHEIAASFTYGREDLIPALFGGIVEKVDDHSGGKLGTFHYYLQRHIALDGEEHGALGREMVALLCAGDPTLEQQALSAAATALNSRIMLWDGIGRQVEAAGYHTD